MATAQQFSFEFRHQPASGVEDFMPAACNRAALAWLDRWPDWPAPALILHGPAGSGKTHLARIWAAHANAAFLTPAAMAPERWPELPSACVLDPADPVVDEVALLQLYNRLKETGGHLLLTARRPAALWPLRTPDLASRLRAAPSVAIEAPDDALLSALLVKLFDDRQLTISEGVVTYLVRHMERSFAAARTLVAELDSLSLQRQRAITVPLVRGLIERGASDQS